MPPLGLDEIESRFGTHPATTEGAEATAPKHMNIRLYFQQFASVIDNDLEDGRYKDLAMTALEEAAMWSHKSIAQAAPVEVV